MARIGSGSSRKPHPNEDPTIRFSRERGVMTEGAVRRAFFGGLLGGVRETV
jgi:hypothetical protein